MFLAVVMVLLDLYQLTRRRIDRIAKSFPEISIRDMVHAERKALSVLGIDKLHTVIGGSLGGMRVLEWGILYPDDMDLLIAACGNAVPECIWNCF